MEQLELEQIQECRSESAGTSFSKITYCLFSPPLNQQEKHSKDSNYSESPPRYTHNNLSKEAKKELTQFTSSCFTFLRTCSLQTSFTFLANVFLLTKSFKCHSCLHLRCLLFTIDHVQLSASLLTSLCFLRRCWCLTDKCEASLSIYLSIFKFYFMTPQNRIQEFGLLLQNDLYTATCAS